MTLYAAVRLTPPPDSVDVPVTVSVSVTVWLKVPAFAVIVILEDPDGAEAAAVKVRVPMVDELALNAGVTLPGNPETLSRIGLLKPFCGVKVKVQMPAAPGAILSAEGESDKVKEGGLAMLSAMEVLALSVPNVPVDVPLMVAVALPPAAELLAVKVTMLVPVVVAGLKLAVTPEGRPETASLTDPLNPFCACTTIALVPLVPAVRLIAAGDAESVKLGAGATVIVIVVVLLSAPETPVTVRVALPGAAFAPARIVTALLRAFDAGLKAAVTPAGNPAMEKLTFAVKPFCGVTVIVLVPLPPAVMLRLAGDAAMLKLGVGAALTVSATLALLLKLPAVPFDVPVIVTVDAPAAAELDAVSVRVLVEVALGALKAAATPLGSPEAVSVTLP